MSLPPPEVCVVGPATWNHIVYVDALPQPRSQMVAARDSWWTMGGTSAGKAVHLASLGVRVELVTSLGNDAAGQAVASLLTSAGVTLTVVPTARTESHTNLMTQGGERLSIYTEFPDAPKPEALAMALERASRARLSMIDLSGLGDGIIADVAASDTSIWVDLHDWDGANGYHRTYAECADRVVMNNDGTAPELIAAAVLEGRPTTVVGTLGSQGAIALTADARQSVNAVATHVVDTNGAGDAFTAGMAAAWLQGHDLGAQLNAGAQQATVALGSRALHPALEQS